MVISDIVQSHLVSVVCIAPRFEPNLPSQKRKFLKYIKIFQKTLISTNNISNQIRTDSTKWTEFRHFSIKCSGQTHQSDIIGALQCEIRGIGGSHVHCVQSPLEHACNLKKITSHQEIPGESVIYWGLSWR